MSPRAPHRIAILAAVGFALPATVQAAQPRGVVTATTGEATAEEPFFPAARPLSAGASVYVYSAVATSREGRSQIFLDDRTLLIVGPQTDVRLESFRLDSGRGTRECIIELTRGRIRLHTELLFGPDETTCEIITPTARVRLGPGHFGVEVGKVQGLPMTRASSFDGQLVLMARDGTGGPVTVDGGARSVVAAGEPAVLPQGFSPRFAQRYRKLVSVAPSVPTELSWYRRSLPGRDFRPEHNPPGRVPWSGEAPSIAATAEAAGGAGNALRAVEDRLYGGNSRLQPVDQEAFRTGDSRIEVVIE